MSVPKKLLNFLQQRKIKHEIVSHKTVFTAFDLAQTMHVKPKEIVKTLVLKLNGKEPVVVMLTADKNLDKKKFLNVMNAWLTHKKAPPEALELKEKIRGRARTLEFAQEKWLREKVLGKPGATPPFGSLLKMPLFVDKQVLTLKSLLLNSGDYGISVKVSVAEFRKSEKFVEGRFGMVRK
jgi:Ala-tRNA(Pro) deacylase